jgi:hypothetical protein
MIVWGGYVGGNVNTGGRYNPGTDSWTATTTNNAGPRTVRFARQIPLPVHRLRWRIHRQLAERLDQPCWPNKYYQSTCASERAHETKSGNRWRFRTCVATAII